MTEEWSNAIFEAVETRRKSSKIYGVYLVRERVQALKHGGRPIGPLKGCGKAFGTRVH